MKPNILITYNIFGEIYREIVSRGNNICVERVSRVNNQ